MINYLLDYNIIFFICLAALSNFLFNLFSSTKYLEEIWNKSLWRLLHFRIESFIHVWIAFLIVLLVFDNYINIINSNTTNSLSYVDKIIDLSQLILGILYFIFLLIQCGRFSTLRHEYYFLQLLIILFLNIILVSSDFLTFFFSLEGYALCSYILIASSYGNSVFYNYRNIYATSLSEASIKYFLASTLFSILFLFGWSFIYFHTGCVSFNDTKSLISVAFVTKNNYYMLLGYFLILSTLIFKLGAAPFHFWIIDVYSSIPLNLFIFLVTLPKLVLFVSLVLIGDIFINTTLISSYSLIFSYSVWLYGIISLVWGFWGTIFQTRLKRFLAYTTLLNTGYSLLGLVLVRQSLYFILLFFISIYLLMQVIFLSLLDHIAFSIRGVELTNITQFCVLLYQPAVLNITLMMLIFSLAGLPPLLGFFIKFVLLVELNSLPVSALSNIAIIVILLGSLLSLFYYIRLVKYLFFIRKRYYIFLPTLPYILSILITVTILLIIISPFFFDITLFNNFWSSNK